MNKSYKVNYFQQQNAKDRILQIDQMITELYASLYVEIFMAHPLDDNNNRYSCYDYN